MSIFEAIEPFVVDRSNFSRGYMISRRVRDAYTSQLVYEVSQQRVGERSSSDSISFNPSYQCRFFDICENLLCFVGLSVR